MLPYFAAAGSHNYMRYGSFYVHHMKSLPQHGLKKMDTDCSLRLLPGIKNAIFTDKFIDMTCMGLGHGPGGATGLTVSDRQMTVWALSFATCGELVRSFMEIRSQWAHNFTRKNLLNASSLIWETGKSLETFLSLAFDPLDQQPYGKWLYIVTGEMAPQR